MDEPEAKINAKVAASLLDRVIALAERNRRPLKEEIAHALERHLGTPPVVHWEVTAEVPALPPAIVQCGRGHLAGGRRAKRKSGPGEAQP